MTPEEIKKELKARGMTMSKISRRLRPRVRPQHVRAVVHGRESARVRRAIARALGRSEAEVWGDAQHTQRVA